MQNFRPGLEEKIACKPRCNECIQPLMQELHLRLSEKSAGRSHPLGVLAGNRKMGESGGSELALRKQKDRGKYPRAFFWLPPQVKKICRQPAKKHLMCCSTGCIFATSDPLVTADRDVGSCASCMKPGLYFYVSLRPNQNGSSLSSLQIGSGQRQRRRNRIHPGYFAAALQLP